VRQIYVVPDADDVRALIDEAASDSPLARLEPLARPALALALGCAAIERKALLTWEAGLAAVFGT
jgi:hypothetical protein